MSLRGLAAALNTSGRYPYKHPEAVADYLVLGGGVVGLAIARHLVQRFPDKSTYLVERHPTAGQETSSRNSEVIHAGFYYPVDSLKTRLCVRGRKLLYDYCQSHNVPFRRLGKLVVGRPHQAPYLLDLFRKAQSLPWPRFSTEPGLNRPAVPLRFLTGEELHGMEPNLSKDITVALFSPETGIIDSHALMSSFEQEITDSDGGNLVYSTEVVRVDPYRPISSNDSSGGWVVQAKTYQPGTIQDHDDLEVDSILSPVLINAAGLSSHLVLNSLISPPIPMYYAKGSYASYRGPGVSGVLHLIYPVPDTNKAGGNHAFTGLGTHLTLDLEGNVRFGPDIEWIQPPQSSPPSSLAHSISSDDIDFWKAHLTPCSDNLEDMHAAITSYLPSVTLSGLQPDYVGIRPKLGSPTDGFKDFVIQKHTTRDFGSAGKHGTMVTLLGIESPGLTSSLAIAEIITEEFLSS